MIEFDFESKCYGCRNCENICPKNAIKMYENHEGFLMPKIDTQKCINCGLCDNVCPHLNFKNSIDINQSDWYSSQLNNKEQLLKSTSGGIFMALAETFKGKNDYICACVWDENMKAEHILEQFSDNAIDKMRQSKYVQSDIGKCCVKINKLLKNEKRVLFVGTPCQVAAVKSFCKNVDKELYTCALICEGVASPKVWHLYKKSLEEKVGSKMEKAFFRNKEIGWDTPVSKYEFCNKKIKKQLSFTNDLYIIGFLQGVFYRKSCSNCQFKYNGHNSDILIGDFWGVKKDLEKKSKNKGLSAVAINSQKGKNLFELIKDKLQYDEIDYDYAVKENRRISEAISINANRSNFFKNIENKEINKNIEENVSINKKGKFIKNILYKIKIYGILKKIIRAIKS